MADDYGTDCAATTDLDPYFTLVSGATVVAQSLARRLQTPPGGLVDDPDYGYDLRSWVNRGMTTRESFELTQRVEAECMKDERVSSVVVSLATTTTTITVDLAVTLRSGETFPLVLTVSLVTVSVLGG